MIDTKILPERQPRVWRKLLILLFVGLPTGLICGELSLRMVLVARGHSYDAEATREGLVQLRSRVLESLPKPGDRHQVEAKEKARTKIIHPFLAFDDLSSHDQLKRDKLRNAELNPETYRVIILGGSVAGLFGMYGVPRLREVLEASPALKGRRVEFMGYARGGHKQPQQLFRLMQLMVLGIRADAVLNLDGFNEVAIGNKNRTQKMDPAYPSYNHWMRFARALGESERQHEQSLRAELARLQLIDSLDSALEQDMFSCALWGVLTRRHVASKRHEYESERDAYMVMLKKGEAAPGVLGPEFEGDAETAVSECVQLWMESSRQIQVLCDHYGMDYLHVLQPTLHDPGAKPITKQEQEKGKINPHWKEGVLIGYPMLREGGLVLAEEGIGFRDASMLFSEVEETLYYDSCHFKKEGNELLAKDIGAAFLPLLED